MSDVNGDNHRARRRAVRSVGPPVEEVGTEKAPVTVTAGAVKAADSAADAPTTKSPTAKSPTAKSPTVESPAAKSAAAKPSTAESTAATAAAAESPAAATAVSVAKTASDPGEKTSVTAHEDGPESASGDATPPEDSEPKARAPRGRLLTVLAAAVLVLALVVGAGASIWITREAGQREDRRAEYVQTARQAVLNLTTIRADSAKEDIDRILSLASGQFKSEFDGRVDPFMSIVQQAKVVSNGEIVEAAVQDDDENQGTVLVAAKQTLTNAGQAEPQTRYYRFRVTVTRTDTGLSASKVEFVA